MAQTRSMSTFPDTPLTLTLKKSDKPTSYWKTRALRHDSNMNFDFISIKKKISQLMST